MEVTQALRTGVIVAFAPRRNKHNHNLHEDFKVGDRIVLDLTLEDLNKVYISTVNARIRAVIET